MSELRAQGLPVGPVTSTTRRLGGVLAAGFLAGAMVTAAILGEPVPAAGVAMATAAPATATAVAAAPGSTGVPQVIRSLPRAMGAFVPPSPAMIEAAGVRPPADALRGASPRTTGAGCVSMNGTRAGGGG